MNVELFCKYDNLQVKKSVLVIFSGSASVMWTQSASVIMCKCGGGGWVLAVCSSIFGAKRRQARQKELRYKQQHSVGV